MIDGIFRQGRLEMSSSPITIEEGLPAWGEMLSNQILVVASVIFFIIMLKDIFKLAPALFYVLQQKHGAQALEYNISMSRIRNYAALICIIPFCLIINRYGLYSPEFMKDVPAEWSSPATIAVFCAFLILRRMMHSSIRPRRMHSDEMASFSHCDYNYFILMSFALTAASFILSACKVGDETSATVILTVCGLFYLLGLIRSGQILRSYCGVLATILYLCALEILPTAILVISAVVF